MTAKAIVVAGVSSVGKTSVSERLQAAFREPYLHVGLGWDLVVDTDHLTPAPTAARIVEAWGEAG